MKHANIFRLFGVVIFCIFLYACAGPRAMGGTSKNCGCGTHKGFVGY